MFAYFKRLKQNHQRFFALLIGTGVILYWRGVWGLADVLIFPSNALYRYLICTGAGLVVLISTHYAIKEMT